jgi:hypothetical protein
MQNKLESTRRKTVLLEALQATHAVTLTFLNLLCGSNPVRLGVTLCYIHEEYKDTLHEVERRGVHEHTSYFNLPVTGEAGSAGVFHDRFS